MTHALPFLLGAVAAALLALVLIVTIRRRFAEQKSQIADAQRRFKATFDQSAVGMAHLDVGGRWLRINERVCDITGYSGAELIGESVLDFIHPDDVEDRKAAMDRLISGEDDRFAVENRYIRKDGSVVWVAVSGSVVRDSRGQPEFLVSVLEDISARKEAEARLVTGEAQYRAVFDSAVEAIAVINSAGIVQSVNPAVEKIFGYVPSEMIGRNIKMLMPDEVAVQHDAYLQRYRETGRRAIIGIGREVPGKRKDGSVFPLDLSVAEWRRDGEAFFTGIMRDVSARKHAETALRASEESLRLLQNEFAHLARVNDLGEMAAAIAHEINQPLTAIVNYLNSGIFLAEGGFSEDHFREALHMMSEASEQALRAGDIVRRLREFIGKGDAVRTDESVEQLVDAAMAIALIDARSSGIEVDRIRGAHGAIVRVDSVQIQQVLVNLLRNAVDALGTLPADCRRRINVSTECAGDRVLFTVADNGPGISPELAGRLFEPFVTTKAHGMGMGLSVCRRIIESHRGTINVGRSAGEGAKFVFELPLAA